MYRQNNRQSKKSKRRGNVSYRNNSYRSESTNAITNIESPFFGPIEPRRLSSFKYSTVVPISVATVSGGQHVFKANGMFDPDSTGTGHQPYGFDQLLNLYQRYVVLRTKYKVSYSPSNDRVMVGTLIASTAPTAVTNLATFELAAESPHAQTKCLPFSGGMPSVFTKNIATNAILGTTREQMIADDLFQGTTTTDPTNLTVLTLFWYNPSPSTVALSVLVEIEYRAMLFDPYLQNQS